MSEFLRVPESARTPQCFNRQLARYFFHKHDKKPNFFDWSQDSREKEELDYLHSIMNEKTRMYGSAEELLENLKIFSNFAGNHAFFHTKFEPYQTEPIIYESLKKEKYICKLDLFVVLQNILIKYSGHLPMDWLLFPLSWLKAEEKRRFGGKRMEFVKLDEKVFEEIEKEILVHFSSHDCDPDQMEKFSSEASVQTVDVIFDSMAQLVSGFFDDAKHEGIRFFGRLKVANEVGTKEELKTFISLIMTLASKYIYAFEQVMKKRPKMFRANAHGPITVRLFEDGDQRFVMNRELMDAVNNPKSVDSEHSFSTMPVKKVLEMFAIQKREIELIRYPILRAKHKATPIMGPYLAGFGNQFVLAVDAFFEHFRVFFFGFTYFQLANDPFKSLDRMCAAFGRECDGPFFMRLDILHRMERSMMSFLESREERDKYVVRSVGVDGFDSEDLKLELESFGLTRPCPEILNHADVVYSEVVKRKREQVLRTCDMFDAIEHCMLICILDRIPKLKIFLHSQKGCARVLGYKCDYCAGLAKIPVPKKPKIKKVECDPGFPIPKHLMRKAMKIANDDAWTHIDVKKGRVWNGDEKKKKKKPSTKALEMERMKKELEAKKAAEVAHNNREKNKKKKERQKRAKMAEKERKGSRKVLEDVATSEDDSEADSNQMTLRDAPGSHESLEDVTTSQNDSEAESENHNQLTSPRADLANEKSSELASESHETLEDVTSSQDDSLDEQSETSDSESENSILKTSEIDPKFSLFEEASDEKKRKINDEILEKEKLEDSGDKEITPETQKIVEDVTASQDNFEAESKKSDQLTSTEVTLGDVTASHTDFKAEIEDPGIKKTPDNEEILQKSPVFEKDSDEVVERKINDGILEENKTLREQILKLQQELTSEKKKASEILEKNREIQELKIQKEAENETNQRMIQQLLDKIASSKVNYRNPTLSRFK